jgi:cellulose synthase operon protein B
VIKAAQALSNNAIRSYVQPNVAFVNSVKSTPEIITALPSRTFADLGYSQRTISNRSSDTTEYRFDIPPGQIVNGAALLTFTYVHSALLDPERSGVTIRLNDQPIGSVRFTDASARLTSADFTLPASLIRSGSNSLQVITDLARFASCSDRNSSDIWFTISPDSLLQIPLTQATNVGSQPFNLLSFPSAFTTQRDLSSTLFVLGQNDPVGWSNAAQIAFDLGRRSNGLIAAPVAVYADALPESLRSQYHMIIVGRASRMPLVTELNNVLPAPFDAGSDFANERDIQVQYRIAPDASVGYLQAIASPWADQKGILTVLGSDDLAVGASTAALLNPANRNRLTTNLTVVNGSQLISAVPALTAPVMPAIVPPTVTATPIVSQPNWIIPAIVITGILMLLVIVVALAQRFQRQRVV